MREPPRLGIFGRRDRARNGRAERAQALLGHEIDDGIGVGRVERLDGVGHGVQAARGRDLGRQGVREERVEDDETREDARISSRRLLSAVGESPDGGARGASVGGVDGDLGDARVERDGLAETDGRAASEGDGAIGAELARALPAGLRGGERHVHARFGEGAHHAVAEESPELGGSWGLLRRGEDERAPEIEAIELRRQAGERTGAEDHVGQLRRVGERRERLHLV